MINSPGSDQLACGFSYHNVVFKTNIIKYIQLTLYTWRHELTSFTCTTDEYFVKILPLCFYNLCKLTLEIERTNYIAVVDYLRSL